MLLPVLVLGGLFGHYATGLVATFGAQCLAIIDQPGGPQRHRTNEMLGGALLGTLTVIITGLASTHPVLIWLAVIAQCFVFSMFTVFGKRGGLIGFAALLLMTLTMHSPLEPDQVLAHAAATLGGACTWRSAWASRDCSGCARNSRPCRWRCSPPPTTAARAAFYDATSDLDDAYRALIQSQSVMTEKHQAARDMVLRARRAARAWATASA